MSRAYHVARAQSRVWIVLVVLSLLSVITPVVAGAATGDVGHEGPSFLGASGSPSGSKPESKLWFNDGRWWASMFDPVSQDFHIFRLDTATQQWTDTGTALDDRTDSRADVLWDGSKLFVASHVFSESPASGTPSRLYRYSYNSSSKTYTLDAGFPNQINNVKTETLVIDKNTGPDARLWATWVQGNTVYVNSANADGTGWETPNGSALPVASATVAKDDISSLVSYGGNKIVVVWSNQVNSNIYYSVHTDGQPNNSWTQTRVALGGPGIVDDHISLRSLQEVNGKVYAAVKTSVSNKNDPLTMLLEYNPAQNEWKSYTYGLKEDAHTRPIVMVDKSASKVYMFATAPESGGSIYMKSAPLSNISFPPGRGTAVMTDGTGGAEDDINNVTSTKQSVDANTGLVVLATNDTTRRYWHTYLPLGGGGGDTGPTASFTAVPTNGQAPLTVQFTDTSTGSPTSWSWDFGDTGTSTAQNPSHTYSSAGTYTVKLTAANANGSGTATGTITVTSGGGGGSGGGTLTLTPTADARVSSDEPNRNFGKSTELRAKSTNPEMISYFKFTVTGLSGPAAVKLRLYVTDPSPDGGSAFQVTGTSWTETGITYANRPALSGSALGSVAATTVNTTVEITLGTIPGNGTYSWAIRSSSKDAVRYTSKETTTKPQLVVTPT